MMIGKTALKILLKLVPSNVIFRLVRFVVAERSRSLSPRKALELLTSLDNDVYQLEGELATKYGNGVHVKHRLINYHQFFTDRINSHQKVLDVGCGYGALAYDIAENTGAYVTGIDIKKSNISLAKSLHKSDKIDYVLGDALIHKFDHNFDVIVLSNVWEHIADRTQFIKNMSLRTSAKTFLIRVPCYERDWRVPLKRELGVEWRLDVTHEIEHTMDAFEAEISESGLTLEHSESKWGEIWAKATIAGI